MTVICETIFIRPVHSLGIVFVLACSLLLVSFLLPFFMNLDTIDLLFDYSILYQCFLNDLSIVLSTFYNNTLSSVWIDRTMYFLLHCLWLSAIPILGDGIVRWIRGSSSSSIRYPTRSDISLSILNDSGNVKGYTTLS